MDLTSYAINAENIWTVAMLILPVLAGMFVYRKVVKIHNKS